VEINGTGFLQARCPSCQPSNSSDGNKTVSAKTKIKMLGSKTITDSLQDKDLINFQDQSADTMKIFIS